MTDELNLLPCPFCGGNVRARWALWPSDGDSDAIIHDGETSCPLEEFQHWPADKSIVALWNTRAVPQPPQEPTPEAVERAARVLALEDAREWDKPAIREIYQERYHDLARAALRAALTAPA